MPPPKIKRLMNEHRGMRELLQKSSLISFAEQGTPPTRYDVFLTCRGLRLDDNQVAYADRHAFEIVLDRDFPTLPPVLTWRTPIFHPNFRPPLICLGDHWYPNWTLAEMCVVICEMVQYKTFNIYDPLNKSAADWLRGELEAEPQRFPVDPRPVKDLDFEITATPGAEGRR